MEKPSLRSRLLLLLLLMSQTIFHHPLRLLVAMQPLILLKSEVSMELPRFSSTTLSMLMLRLELLSCSTFLPITIPSPSPPSMLLAYRNMVVLILDSAPTCRTPQELRPSPLLSPMASQDGSTVLSLVMESPIAKPAWFSLSTLPRSATPSKRSRSSLPLSLFPAFPALHQKRPTELLAQLAVLLRPTPSRLAV